jgi:hypothetical protein
MLSFNGYGDHHLQRYYEQQWREVARPVPQGEWTRFRVRFDADQRIAEYYCGDMEHPTSVETDLEWKPTEGQNTMHLLIGNYGLCTGTLVHRVDNVVLQELPEAPPGAAGPGVTIYRGLSFERLRTAEIIREMKVENPSVFTLLTGLGLGPQNRFFLDRMPPVLTASRDRLILMVDLPVGPGEALPPFVQQKIRADVAHGARLIILGGPVTLGNGCFQGSPLEEILPVELHGPWEIKPARQPLRLHSPEPSLKDFFGGPEQHSVFFYHQVQPKVGARVLAYADDLPILIEKAYQEGSVIVFAAAPLGQSTEGHPGYWEWSRWPEFIVQAAGLREGEKHHE